MSITEFPHVYTAISMRVIFASNTKLCYFMTVIGVTFDMFLFGDHPFHGCPRAEVWVNFVQNVTVDVGMCCKICNFAGQQNYRFIS